MSKIPVSVIIVTKNAAGSLEMCLAALRGFDDIIVVDSYSADQTTTIAASHGASVINFKWNGVYPKKREWCLRTLSLKHDWVLFIDADEVMTSPLREEITNALSAEYKAAGYFIKGQYIWNGKVLKFGLTNRKIALLNRRHMEFPVIDDLDCEGMGEIEGHYQPVLKQEYSHLKIGKLNAPLHHYANHSQTEWLERHKRYAVWEKCMNDKAAWPKDPIPWRQTLKAFLRKNVLKPELMFVHSYILKLGFLDGAAGFDFAKSRWRYYRMILRE